LEKYPNLQILFDWISKSFSAIKDI